MSATHGMSKANWDVGIRSEQYSIGNKREKFAEFQEQPSVKTLTAAAETWWATVARWSVDHYVTEVMLDKGHTPKEIRDMILEVAEGAQPITDADIPGMGMATLTEVLEIIDPERFVALNAKSREGMEVLGYNVPEGSFADDDYRAFVDDVKEAVTTYDLRQRVAGVQDVGDISDAHDTDVAQAAFNLHVEDEFPFDLHTVRDEARQERVVDIEVPRGLYDKVGAIVDDELLYTDEEDYIKTKLREAVQNDT